MKMTREKFMNTQLHLNFLASKSRSMKLNNTPPMIFPCNFHSGPYKNVPLFAFLLTLQHLLHSVLKKIHQNEAQL